MSDLSNGVKLAILQGQLLSGEINSEYYIKQLSAIGMSQNQATESAEKYFAIAADELSVVDARLRVYGTKNLRIADASIMPIITTGNTQAPCVMIGERMAEILQAA